MLPRRIAALESGIFECFTAWGLRRRRAVLSAEAPRRARGVSLRCDNWSAFTVLPRVDVPQQQPYAAGAAAACLSRLVCYTASCHVAGARAVQAGTARLITSAGFQIVDPAKLHSSCCLTSSQRRQTSQTP